MLSIQRNYLLKDSKQLHARVEVIPTGLLEIEIIEKHQTHAAEFEHIQFERKGRVTQLIGQNDNNGKAITWKLPLANDDAKELEHLIEEASEELEILMRDL